MVEAELADARANTMTHDGDGKRRHEDSGGARILRWDGENTRRQTDLANHWLRARVCEDGGGWSR